MIHILDAKTSVTRETLLYTSDNTRGEHAVATGMKILRSLDRPETRACESKPVANLRRRKNHEKNSGSTVYPHFHLAWLEVRSTSFVQEQ
jgi:hypothetical protein